MSEVFTSLAGEMAASQETALEEADTHLDQARATVTISAAMSLVEVLAKGKANDDLATKAQALLDTKLLPEALRVKVKAIADSNR